MTHMYFSPRVEGRISYGHLGRKNLFSYIFFMKCVEACGCRSPCTGNCPACPLLNAAVLSGGAVWDVVYPDLGSAGYLHQQKYKKTIDDRFKVKCHCRELFRVDVLALPMLRSFNDGMPIIVYYAKNSSTNTKKIWNNKTVHNSTTTPSLKYGVGKMWREQILRQTNSCQRHTL